MPVELIPVSTGSLPAGSTLLQTELWARLKSEFGWEAHRFRVGGVGGDHRPLLLLTRRMRAGFALAYLPHPLADLPLDTVATLPKRLVSALSDRLPAGLTLLRIDFAHEADGSGLTSQGLFRAPVDVQPASTVVLDLDCEPTDLLASMKPKTRYNIRLAEKRGVTVREVSGSFLPRWYELYRETAERDRIVLHSGEYYQRLFDLAQEAPDVRLRLLIAEHEGDLLAGVVISQVGTSATYLYGASSNAKRNLMASYAVQWEAMRRVREDGCRTYDLFGIPPTDDPAHPMAGLYRFKTGFGGRIVHRAGCWDARVQPLRSALFCAAERARTFYFKRVRRSF